MSLATPMEMGVGHDGSMIRLDIAGVGTLSMPPDTAHWLARQLVGATNELEKVNPPLVEIRRRINGS